MSMIDSPVDRGSAGGGVCRRGRRFLRPQIRGRGQDLFRRAGRGEDRPGRAAAGRGASSARLGSSSRTRCTSCAPQTEAEIKERRQELTQLENRLLSREEGLDEMQKDMARREQSVTDREAHYRKVIEEAEAAKAEQQRQLEDDLGHDERPGGGDPPQAHRGRGPPRHGQDGAGHRRRGAARGRPPGQGHPLDLHPAHRRQPRGRHHRVGGASCPPTT